MNEHAWIAMEDSEPCFVCFGFPTNRKVEFKKQDGTEGVGLFLGYSEFSENGMLVQRGAVTHWRPTEATAVLVQTQPDKCPHESHEFPKPTPEGKAGS